MNEVSSIQAAIINGRRRRRQRTRPLGHTATATSWLLSTAHVGCLCLFISCFEVLGSVVDCGKTSISWSDLDGDKQMNRDPEYLHFLEQLSRKLEVRQQHFEALPRTLQDNFRAFASSNGKINITESFNEAPLSKDLEEFCRASMKSIEVSGYSHHYRRRQQETVDSPNISDEALKAPSSAPRQALRPSINQDTRPEDGPTMPTPEIGGIQISLPTESTPMTPPPSTSPNEIPTLFPTIGATSSSPAPTDGLENSTPLPTSVPTMSTPSPSTGSFPGPSPQPVGANLTPRPTPGTGPTPPPFVSASVTGRPSQAAESVSNQSDEGGVSVSAECKSNIEFSDINGDDILDKNEYLTLVYLIANEQVALSFSDLPQSLQDSFNEWTSEGTAPLDVSTLLRSSNIFQHGRRMAELGTICTETANLLNEGTTTTLFSETQSTPPLVSSLAPTPTREPSALSTSTGMPTQALTTTGLPSQSPAAINTPGPSDTDVSSCLDAASLADFDGDGTLNEAEFVAFVNVLGDGLIASTFSDLTTALVDAFDSLTANTINFSNSDAAAVVQFCQLAGKAIAGSPVRGSGLSALVDLIAPSSNSSSSSSEAPSMQELILVLESKDDAADETDQDDQNWGLIIGLTVGLSALLMMAIVLGFLAHKAMLRKHVYAPMSATAPSRQGNEHSHLTLT